MGSRISSIGATDNRLHSMSYSSPFLKHPVYTTDERRTQNILIGRPQYGETFAIHNPKRFGKSLTAVFMIIERLKREAGTKLLSNMFFDLTPLEPIKSNSDYMPLTDIEQIRNIDGRIIIFVDEMRRLTDSRMAASSKNRFISNLLADTGKSKLDLYYTDQDCKAVDKRVRINVDYILAPYYNHVNGWCRVLMWDKMEKFEMFQEGWQKWNPPIFEFAFFAPPYFKFYKTGEKIEDYSIKFKVKRFAKRFVYWCDKKGLEYTSKSLSLYSTTEGEIFSGKETKAIVTFIELVDEGDWHNWE